MSNPRRPMSQLTARIAFVCASLAASATALAQVSVVTIPALPNKPNVVGYALSGDGTTVVGNMGGPELPYIAFVWRASTGSVQLAGPAGGPSRNGDEARDCSFDGSVIVGNSTFNFPNLNAYYVANKWSNGVLAVLPDLPSSPNPNVAMGSYATTVARDGSVAFGVGIDASYQQRAVRWVGNGPAEIFAAPGFARTAPNQTSADASIVVGAAFNATGYINSNAFRWSQGTGFEILTPLAGNTAASAAGITPDGTLICGASFRQSGVTVGEATIWNAGVPQGLGTLPGDSLSVAGWISADGQRVFGNSGVAEGVGFDIDSMRPFVWTPASGMLDLLDVLEGQGVDLSVFQSLTNLVDVSDDGNSLLLRGLDANSEWRTILVSNLGTPCLPTVVSHPSSNALCPVDGGTMSFDATGTGTLSQAWQIKIGDQYVPVVDGLNTFPATGLSFIASNASSSNLQLQSITIGTAANPLTLRGRVTDSCGTTSTLPASITVATLSITTHPQSSTVCSGQGASFGVGAGSNVPVTFQWQVSAPDTPEGWRDLNDGPDEIGMISGATSSQVSFSPDPSLQLGTRQVRCIVSNDCESVESNEATFLVESSDATITLQPVDASLCQDTGAAVLTVQATGTTTPALRWQVRYAPASNEWIDLYDGVYYYPFLEAVIANISGSQSATLSVEPTFDSIAPADWNVEFRCVPGTTCDGIASDIATVSVLTVPELIQGPGLAFACEGVPISFVTRISEASAPATFAWTLFGTPIDPQDSHYSISSDDTSSTLTILAPSVGDIANDGEGYACTATNACGSATTWAAGLALIEPTDPACAPACPACAADYDGNGGVDGGDLAAFFADFEAGASCADVDANGGVDGGDLAYFFSIFEAGGC